MKIRELHLTDLSLLRSRVYLCEFGGNHNPTALVLEFIGKYGCGSLGNDDAAYMQAVTSAWLAVVHVNGIVFDLRQMQYEWGNSLWNVFRSGDVDDAGSDAEGEPAYVFPRALVVSDLCRQGFSTCRGIVPPMFDDLEEALRFVEIPARKYLTEMFDWLDSRTGK